MADGKEWRVLMVDDDEEWLSLVQAAAASASLQLDTAHDGDVAIRLYGRGRQNGKPYDGVVLDGVMPGLSGYHVATVIRERDTTIRIAFQTAHVNNLWRHWAQELGVTAFWEKPVPPDELVQCIKQWLSAPPAPVATNAAATDAVATDAVATDAA